ncbi:MAG: hypothetical protein AAFY06_16130 [Pseudomonadota bacterium]
MKATAALISLLVLAGCGIDGPPSKPTAPFSSGVTISGEASIGVVGRL